MEVSPGGLERRRFHVRRSPFHVTKHPGDMVPSPFHLAGRHFISAGSTGDMEVSLFQTTG